MGERGVRERGLKGFPGGPAVEQHCCSEPGLQEFPSKRGADLRAPAGEQGLELTTPLCWPKVVWKLYSST